MLRRAEKSGRVQSRQNAFTLIELLVVIAIIATLVGILLPSLAKARESARSGKCATQTRQMATSMALYATEFKNWYPLVPFTQASWRNWIKPFPTSVDRRLRASVEANQGSIPSLGVQFFYGGVAGLFSLYQNPEGGEGPPVGDSGFTGNMGNISTSWYIPQPPIATNPRLFTGPGIQTPLMRSYLDGFGVLTCPSDKEDRYYGYGKTPISPDPGSYPSYANAKIKIPQIPGSESEVISYNISYMYIAGAKADDPSVPVPFPLWGDETNGPDINTRAWYNGGSDARDAGVTPGYYAKNDNHGTSGANFAYTDGHVAFINQNVLDVLYGDKSGVNAADRSRSFRLESID